MSTISSAISIHSSPESVNGLMPSPPAAIPYSGAAVALGIYGNPLHVNAGHTPAVNHTQHALGGVSEPSTPTPAQMPRSDCGSGWSSDSNLLCSESIGRGYDGSPDSIGSAWQLWTNRDFEPARRNHRMRSARNESYASNPFGFF